MNTSLTNIFDIYLQQDTTDFNLFKFYLNNKLILITEPIIWDDESKSSGDVKQWHDIYYELQSILSNLEPKDRIYTVREINNILVTGTIKFYII